MILWFRSLRVLRAGSHSAQARFSNRPTSERFHSLLSAAFLAQAACKQTTLAVCLYLLSPWEPEEASKHELCDGTNSPTIYEGERPQ